MRRESLQHPINFSGLAAEEQIAYINDREVGAGRRLANLVRAGRQQPQRVPLGSLSISHLIPDIKNMTQTERPKGPPLQKYHIHPLTRYHIRARTNARAVLMYRG
jgi:hypothetical protein